VAKIEKKLFWTKIQTQNKYTESLSTSSRNLGQSVKATDKKIKMYVHVLSPLGRIKSQRFELMVRSISRI
jgi:hypothetical protein